MRCWLPVGWRFPVRCPLRPPPWGVAVAREAGTRNPSADETLERPRPDARGVTPRTLHPPTENDRQSSSIVLFVNYIYIHLTGRLTALYSKSRQYLYKLPVYIDSLQSTPIIQAQWYDVPNLNRQQKNILIENNRHILCLLHFPDSFGSKRYSRLISDEKKTN